MDIISDTIDESGKRHVVGRYTDEEKAAMAARTEAHRAEMEEKRAEREAARKERLNVQS